MSWSAEQIAEIMGMMWQALKNIDERHEYPDPVKLELDPSGEGGIFYVEYDGRHISVQWIVRWENLDMATLELQGWV